MVNTFGSATGFEKRDRGEQIHCCAGVTIGVADDGHLDLAGGGAHAVAAAEKMLERFHRLWWEDGFDRGADEGCLAAGVEHLGERAVGEHDTTLRIKCGNRS